MGGGADQGPLGTTVGSSEIEALAVTTPKIAAKAVTLAKVADGTANKVLGYDSSGVAAVKSAALELLDLHVCAGSEASYTFTPASALTDANYTEIIVIYTGDTSGATSMLMQVNGDTTANYRYGFNEIASGGTNTVVAATGQTSAMIGRCQNSWLVYVKVTIILATGTAAKGGNTSSVGITTYLSTHGSWEHDSMTGNVTAIKILLNAGNFEDGSQIAIYGVKRA